MKKQIWIIVVVALVVIVGIIYWLSGRFWLTAQFTINGIGPNLHACIGEMTNEVQGVTNTFPADMSEPMTVGLTSYMAELQQQLEEDLSDCAFLQENDFTEQFAESDGYYKGKIFSDIDIEAKQIDVSSGTGSIDYPMNFVVTAKVSADTQGETNSKVVILRTLSKVAIDASGTVVLALNYGKESGYSIDGYGLD